MQVGGLLHAALVADVAAVPPAERPAELLPLVQHCLAEAGELRDDERQRLYAAFASLDVSSEPTFRRGLDRLSNDVACLTRRQQAQHQMSGVLV